MGLIASPELSLMQHLYDHPRVLDLGSRNARKVDAFPVSSMEEVPANQCHRAGNITELKHCIEFDTMQS